MTTRCKVRELAVQALDLEQRAIEIDLETVNSASSAELQGELQKIDRALFEIDAEASRRYANSIFGAAFQISVARRALETLRVSDVTDEQRDDLMTRVDRVFESVTKYLGQVGEPEHWGKREPIAERA